MRDRVSRNKKHGFYQLDPKPSADALDEYYTSRYYHQLQGGGKASDLRRLIQEGAERESESDWKNAAEFADFVELLRRHNAGKHTLDVGCGTGDFVAHLDRAGFCSTGLEPSEVAVEVGRGLGHDIHRGQLKDVPNLSGHMAQKFDVLSLLHVLEHVPDPIELLDQAGEAMADEGLILVSVPNDFNPLQEAAVDAYNLGEWWILDPDHISYFDFESLESLINDRGFELLERYTSFPMELFLLMGELYVDDPEIGSICHSKRKALELNLSRAVRMRLYNALADKGFGRDCIVLARKL